MPRTTQLIRELMHERAEATRPQIAAATGLSLVTVNKSVAQLCRAGELVPAGDIPSGGGRPVRLYRYAAGYAQHLLIEIKQEGTFHRVSMEQMDLYGNKTGSRYATFAHLHPESLDTWLDSMQRKKQIRSMTLCMATERKALTQHLAERYPCIIRTPSPAALLAERREGSATIHFTPGTAPTCATWKHGRLSECGALGLLPFPERWENLDGTDHTLVEEMLSLLIQSIVCILNPAGILLYTPSCTPRLMERIRFNSATKLHGQLPPLSFRPLTEKNMRKAIISYITTPPAPSDAT